MKLGTITYANSTSTLGFNEQYFLMQAKLTNGSYSSTDFTAKLKDVSLEYIDNPENKLILGTVRQEMLKRARVANKLEGKIVIENFSPKKKQIITFVNTTLDEMLAQIEK